MHDRTDFGSGTEGEGGSHQPSPDNASRDAVLKLVEPYFAAAATFARKIVRDDDSAWDAVTHAALALAKKVTPADLVARTEDHRRREFFEYVRRSALKIASKERRRSHASSGSEDAVAAPADSREVLRSALTRALNDPRAKLSDREAIALRLYLLEGRDHGAIARLLGVKRGNSRKIRCDAIKKLEGYLEKHHPEEYDELASIWILLQALDAFEGAEGNSTALGGAMGRVLQGLSRGKENLTAGGVPYVLLLFLALLLLLPVLVERAGSPPRLPRPEQAGVGSEASRTTARHDGSQPRPGGDVASRGSALGSGSEPAVGGPSQETGAPSVSVQIAATTSVVFQGRVVDWRGEPAPDHEVWVCTAASDFEALPTALGSDEGGPHELRSKDPRFAWAPEDEAAARWPMGRANLLVPRRTRTDAEGRFALPGSTARSTADLPTCLIVATGPSGDQFVPWTPAGPQPLPVELPVVTLQPRITLSITIDKPELGNDCRVRFASPSVSGRELLRAGEGWQTVFVASPHRPPIRLGVAVVPPDEWSRDVAFLVMNHSKEHRFDLVASGEITGRVVDDEQGLWAARCSLHAWPTPQRAEWTPAPDLARLLAGDAAVGGASAEDGTFRVHAGVHPRRSYSLLAVSRIAVPELSAFGGGAVTMREVHVKAGQVSAYAGSPVALGIRRADARRDLARYLSPGVAVGLPAPGMRSITFRDRSAHRFEHVMSLEPGTPRVLLDAQLLELLGGRPDLSVHHLQVE